MTSHNLSVEAALGTMRAIAAYTSTDFDALGISPVDFSLTYDDIPWTRDSRRRVMSVIDSLLFGTLDVLGLPRIAVPAEYAGAVLATFVAPVNRLTACIWLAEQRMIGRRAIDLAATASDTGEVDPTSASQLFALVVLLSESDVSSAVRQHYKARMGDRLQKLMGE